MNTDLNIDAIVAAVVAVIVVLATISIYNGIIRRFNAVRRAWADVHTYERQKVQILESLEPLVAKYMRYERGVLEQITTLRGNILGLGHSAPDLPSLQQVETHTRTLMRKLLVSLENYPELKANTVFLNLMTQISAQNENVGAAISIYNRNVELFNSGIETFPDNLVNSVLAHKIHIEEFRDAVPPRNIEYRPNVD